MTGRVSGGLAAALVLLLGGCGGDSTGPSSGSLTVTVSGLPGGTPASVGVSGPGGYNRSIDGSVTLSGLPPGSYTVTAAPVTAGATVYSADPDAQTVAVSEGATPAAAQVTYAVATGSLVVTISGLPNGTDAAVQVTGPGGFQQALTATATLTALTPGSYTVTAASVSSGASQYSPTPATRQAAVTAGGSVSAPVTYTAAGAAGLNLRIDGVYLTQSVQTYAGAVPLVANRAGYLRVFVTASETNSVSPDVRVRFYHAGVPVSEQMIVRGGSTPLAPQEGALSSSWNLPVSGTLIQPGLSLQVEVDPADLVAETDEGDNLFPATGLPLVADVRTASQFRVTLVPIITSVDGRLGNVTAGNKDQFLTATMQMHALSSYDAVVGGALTIGANVPALQSDNGNGSWNTVLSELQARRTADASSRYYLGVVNPSYSSGVAGVGYVGYPAALSWDKASSAASIAAHEWGHNWGRNHAPCGGAGNPDPQYPYAEGVIGVYGLDVAAAALKPPSYHDLMGYCSNEWISDYTYRSILQYRASEAGLVAGFTQAVQPSLVVWGRVEAGRVVLEPAFQAVTRPSLPSRDGPYRMEGRAADGSRIFSLSFSPIAVADDRRGAAHFAFAVPLSPERAARLETLTVEGEGRSTALARIGGAAPTVEAVRSGPDRVELRWDSVQTPLVVVRDSRSGEILSFARGGRAEVATSAPELSLTLSDRLRSRDVRAQVRAR